MVLTLYLLRQGHGLAVRLGPLKNRTPIVLTQFGECAQVFQTWVGLSHVLKLRYQGEMIPGERTHLQCPLYILDDALLFESRIFAQRAPVFFRRTRVAVIE